jgi:hypothetical protein
MYRTVPPPDGTSTSIASLQSSGSKAAMLISVPVEDQSPAPRGEREPVPGVEFRR